MKSIVNDLDILYTKSVVRTLAKIVVVQKITKKMLQRQFLEYKTTRSLGDKLLENKIQENNLYAKSHRCRSILKYIRVLFRCFRSWLITFSSATPRAVVGFLILASQLYYIPE